MTRPQQPSPLNLPSRREFVKSSSTIALGAAVLGTGLSAAHAGTAVGDKQIKVALIGCGGRGTDAAVQALSTKGNVTLWTMADAFAPQIERSLDKITRTLEQRLGSEAADKIKGAIQVPAERQFAGLDAYQKAIDSGADLVIHATPPGFRPKHVEAAINAGKHVFTEKPLAVDAPGVRRMLAAGKTAGEKGLCVGVGLQRHHDPAYIETVKRLQDGAIGDISLTRVFWNSGPLWLRTRGDFYKSYGHEPTEMEYQVNNWYYFNWLCGDHIVEQHIHNIDVSNWVKQSHPISAQGAGGRERRTSSDFGQIFDHHVVEFTYPDGSTMLSECRHMDGCWNQVAEFATGIQGRANISGGLIKSPEGEWKYEGEHGDPYQLEHDDMFAAIRAGTPYNEMEYGAHSTMTAIMGRMATYSGKMMEWDEALNSEIDLSPKDYDFAAAPPVVPDAKGNYPVPVPGVTKVVYTAMIESIDHVNLVVRDLNRMTAFYRDALGFVVTKQVTISGAWIDEVVGLRGVEADVVYLDLPSGPRIELIDYRAPLGIEPGVENEPNVFGLRHMAFRVSDIDSVAKKIEAAGVSLQSEIKSVPDSQVTYAGGVRKRLVYFRDPEGNLLELCEYR